MDQLNHPIAVVAILAGIAVFLREIAWFIKTVINKKNGGVNGRLEKTLDNMNHTLQKMNTNFILLNEMHKQVKHGVERTHDAVLGCQARRNG